MRPHPSTEEANSSFFRQLQPLPGRRCPRCPPQLEGGQETYCRAPRRDGPAIFQVAGKATRDPKRQESDRRLTG